MRLSRNNHLQMHDQNMVEDENNNITNNTNDNNDNTHNANTSNNNNNNNNYNNNGNNDDNNNDNNNNNNNNNQNEPRVPWRQRFMSAFNYNKSIDYKNDSHVSIGNMNTKCNFCHAFKWPKEPPGLCCSGGKVLLAEIAISANKTFPPEPLKVF